jgi:uncharacterized protein YdeI (YjbR/CyaY-like superfamily)
VPALDEAPRLQPADRADWRRWLAANHASAGGVWLVSFTQRSGRMALSYDESVEEALCFGWIDSTTRPLDGERRMVYFAPRRPRGTWARSNKDRVERLIASGRMTAAGLAAIERAKADGSWAALDPVESMVVPDDLASAFGEHPRLRRRYDDLTDSGRRQLLWWVVSAKREPTRARRIAELVRRSAGDEPLLR